MRLAAAASGQWLFAWDPGADRIEWLHAPNDTLIGLPIAELCREADLLQRLHAEDQWSLREASAAARSLQPAPVAMAARLRNGRQGWSWLELRARWMPDAGNSGGRLVGSFQDVSLVRQLEGRLALSALMIESVSDAVLLTDAAGRIGWANAASAELFDLPPAVLMDRTIGDFCADSHERRLERQQEIRDVLARQGQWRGLVPMRTARGDLIPTEAIVTRVQGDDGELWLHVHRDRRGQAQAQLEASTSMRTEQLRLGSLLHESVGQDLTAASLLLAGLRRQLDPQLAGRVSEIESLLRDAIGDCRRMAQELPSYVLEHQGLGVALDDLTRRAERRSGVRCTVSVSGTLESLPIRLGQMLYRAVESALEQLGSTGAACRIEVRVWRDEDQFIATMTDPDGRAGEAWAQAGARAVGEELELLGASIDVVASTRGGRRLILQIPAALIAAPEATQPLSA